MGIISPIMGNPLSALKRFGFDWRTLLSAILIVLSFPPWDIAPLIWISLIPWFFALTDAGRSKRPYRAAFVQGLWLSIWMSLLGFFWVAYVLKQFGNLPLPLAILGLVLYSFIGQPQFYLFAPLHQFIYRRLSYSYLAPVALLIALTYAGMDWLIPKLFVDTLGHSLYSARNLRQVADIGGAPLLTFLIFLTNTTLWMGIVHYRNLSLSLKRLIPLVCVLATLLASGWVYGYFRSIEIQKKVDTPIDVTRFAVIQANIGDFDKVAAESGYSSASRKILATYYQLSSQALQMEPKPQALVWPETSYPSTFRTPMSADEFARDKQLERFVRESGVPLFFGGYDHSNGLDYNALFILEPEPSESILSDGKLQTYRKNILLLFGEYIPGSEWIPAIKRMFPQVGNFGRGIGPQAYTLDLPSLSTSDSATPVAAEKPSRNGMNETQKMPIRVGPVICYEVLFPSYVIEAARKGSQMIMNVTNDSWFGPWGEPQLHLALSAFRSIETRLPQLRATNTGISALILPTGEITQETELFKPEILMAEVPIVKQSTTLMLLWGDWFAPIALLIGASGLLIFIQLRRKNHVS